MRRHRRRFDAVLVAWLALAWLVPWHAAIAAPTPLLLISIDGYRPDYLKRGFSPNLQALADGGVRAVSMQPSFPSLTFPNHYTLVTGLRPDHHGVINNAMLDPQLGHFAISDRTAVRDGRWWSQATPLWETADAHGLRTATMFWPGSEAPIHGHQPDDWSYFDATVTPTQRVDRVLAWLDRPLAQRPVFMTLYFDGVDHAGHHDGPDSPQVDAALREVDDALGRLRAGLRARALDKRINLVVVSDHGMASVPVDHNVLLDKLLPLARVQVVNLGILAGVNPASASTADRADFARIEATLERPQAHMHCWDRTRVPERFVYGHHPRTPQLLCLADVGWRIATSDYLAQKKASKDGLSIGEHGYDNAAPEMQALFVANGPAFRSGVVVPSFPNVDVYPLLTHLLGVPAQPNDGRFEDVRGMLKEQH